MNQKSQSERYRQMTQIVASLMGKDASQWNRLVAEACGGDRALEAMVLDVLIQMEGDTGELKLPPEVLKLEQLGPYRIVETLGEGGMGVVYLAERNDQFRQKVAIKCLRSEFANKDDVTRFNMERQILARLNHPHIARILDGGITQKGMPYFVMEHVEGMPITRYADHHRLDLKARLGLVEQVCAAVHYANQNLIVHRDLKPSNILVQTDGHVKLLDFGIAKLLGQNDPFFSDMTAVETKTGMSIMTLQYASPEQYLGQQATVATDVYALGLLLYELLVGQRPYVLKGLSRPQVSEVILKHMPTKPSRLAEISKKPTQQTHGVTPKMLGGKLAGDLDCMVMMALRKEPERRYSSVFELNQDIQAYLKGRPVSAHPERWSYTLSKFVTRNKLLVGFVMVLLASLLTITLLSVRFANMTHAKNTQIAVERDEAEAIAKFLVTLLEGSDPLVQNANPTLREVLLRARQQLDEDTEISRDARTQLHLSLMGVFISYELNDEAETLIEQVLASETDAISQSKALASKAVLFGNKGQFQEAEKLYDTALEALQSEEDFEFVSKVMLIKGIHLLDATKFSEGIAYLEALLKSEKPMLVPVKISALRNIGRGHSETGHFEEANRYFDKAETLIHKHLGPNAMALFDIQLNRILTIAGNGDFETALAMANEAIPQVVSVLGESHSLACGALVTKATCLSGLARFEEALSLRLSALECMQNAYGNNHHQVIYLHNELGVNYSDMGRKEKAIEIYREAVRLADTHLRPGHLYQAITRTNLGSALDQVGRSDEALEFNKEAYETIKQNPDAKNFHGACAFLYGMALNSSGRQREALLLFDEALVLAREFPNQLHYLPGLVNYHAATAYEALEEPQQAVAQYEAAFDDFVAQLGPEDSGTISVFQKLKTIYEENGTPELLGVLKDKLEHAKTKKDIN